MSIRETDRPSLGLFHTTALHIPTFERLAAKSASRPRLSHVVRDDLLLKAEREGLTPALRLHTEEALLALAASGVDAVMCTCSTLGEAVDGIAGEAPVPVLRVDAPMADRAVRIAAAGSGSIFVAAALGTSLRPTRRLIEQKAATAKADITVCDLEMGDLWPLFRAGLMDDYHARIAEALSKASAETDVIVLAQASMAPALDLMSDCSVPILTSPESGFQAALEQARLSRSAALETQRAVA